MKKMYFTSKKTPGGPHRIKDHNLESFYVGSVMAPHEIVSRIWINLRADRDYILDLSLEEAKELASQLQKRISELEG